MKRKDTRPTMDHSQKDEKDEETQSQQVYHSGSVTPEGGKHKIHCLTIIGQVEGHYILPPQNKTTKYEHVIPQLVAIEQDSSIKGLLMILNTVGGDVEAGLAISELVSGMKTPTVSLVLGGGHSIGVPLAVSSQYSFIAPTATMTVHPVRMNGVMLGVPQTLSYFDKMQERITNFVCQNSRISPERFKELMMNSGELVMDIGTVLDGELAVKEGLIDSLGGLNDAISKLYELIEALPPEADKAPDTQTPASKDAKKPQSPLKTKPPASKKAKSGGDTPKAPKTRKPKTSPAAAIAAVPPTPTPGRKPGRPPKNQPPKEE